MHEPLQRGTALDMDRVSSTHEPAFLYTQVAGTRHLHLAASVLVASILIFLAAAPYARTPLPQVFAFIPIYQSALITNDLITAVLLLGQYSFLRARALLVLASGYLFSAFMAIAHALSFPGLFSSTGALNAGPQTTAWLYFLWHGGFPLFVLSYLYVKKHPTSQSVRSSSVATPARRNIMMVILGTVLLSVLLVMFTTTGHDLLPAIMRGNKDDSGKQLVAACTWSLSLIALVRVWQRRPRSVLDLWLCVTLVAWVFDIALASVLNGGRFDLGFYAGRVYGLLASSFVLIVMLLENGRLYADLAEANERERERGTELEDARIRADAATQAKSNFLATMSHEIRTPMNGVIGMIDVLARSSLKAHQVSMVDLIRESAYSLLSIIDDILDFSKIEAGRLEIEHEPIAISEVVEKVCIVLNRLAEKQKVELSLFTDPCIPEVVLGDALRLRQVLINLTNNAIKFSGGTNLNGRVIVRAELVERTDQGVIIEFRIIDNGIGMDAATIDGLFHAFVQADLSTTRRFGGTGLGLTISDNLAHLMDGSISVTSTPGKGSTFVLRLPFSIPLVTPHKEKQASLIVGLSCLVIGNGETLSGDLIAYLEDAGAAVRQVRTLEDAGEMIATLPAGLWVWIVNTPSDSPVALEALREVARMNATIDVRFVIVCHGHNRYPNQFDADRICIDGNVLTRSALLQAVAIAAGRARYADEQVETAAARLTPVPVALSREEARRQNRLILVVEDNEINQKVVMQQLSLLGFTADLAGEGQQALLGWRSGDYALIITDLHMPGMDGYQLTSAIRSEEFANRAGGGREPSHAHSHHTPIIALTANALKSEATRCLEAGMDDYMSKPTPLVDLQAVLEKWLPISSNPPTSPSIETSPTLPVDVRVLHDQIGENQGLISEFLNEFKKSALNIGQDIAKACAEVDAQRAIAAAHKLKSAARAVGALPLGELCASIEEIAKSDHPEELHSISERFQVELRQVDDYLASILTPRNEVGP